MTREHIHFVTGRLAEPSLRQVLAELAPQVEFDYSIGVLGISVAALMTPAWVARKLQTPPQTTRVMLPGHCAGDLAPVVAAAGAPVELGPKDLRELPEHFGRSRGAPRDYGAYDVEILAEINHAPRLSRTQLLEEAASLAADGADVIDVGCEPGYVWHGVADAVKALRDAGRRVSIDSMEPAEIEPAVRAGAELVLSVNAATCERAVDWGCEVVIVPDEVESLAGLGETADFLAQRGVRFRLDPVLEPIGFGFARSLARYFQVRREFPRAEMLMGIGNLTELTDADSAAVNVVLLGFCQEMGIRSVLTTQVIHWAKNCVRECDLARRLVHYAVSRRTLPKHVEPRLVPLRGDRPLAHGPAALARLASEIKDRNYRLFAEDGELHVIARGRHLADADPFALFERLQASEAEPPDASHAFYLGFEMAKALTALTLGKDYRQDQALEWGYLSRPETSRHERQKRAADARKGAAENKGAAEKGE